MSRTILLPNTIALVMESLVGELLKSDEHEQPNGVRFSDVVEEVMPQLNDAWKEEEGNTAASHPGMKEMGCVIQMAALVQASWNSAYKHAEQMAHDQGYRLEIDAIWEMPQMTAGEMRRFSAANANPVLDAGLAGEMTARSLLVLLVPLAVAEEADRRHAHIQSLNERARTVIVPQIEPA